MYKVLARKYRPQNFDDFVGQGTIVNTLKRAIEKNKTAYAYIFAGPRGSGKTSMARVFAKALNCEKGPTTNPCNKCEICNEITAGTSLDVIEIDGASNRGIEEIRALRENVNLRPSKARYKIYVIDEVHMLTTEAFNALLKTLEEPPEYVKFIFATTAPEKIPPTIISRCQRFDFKPLTLKEIEKKISEISKKENFKIEKGAISVINEFANGSLRDVLSIVDQLIVFSEGKITIEDVRKLLGIVDEKGIDEILKSIVSKNINQAISSLHKLISEGKDPVLIIEGIIKRLRDILVFKIEDGEKGEIFSYFDKMTTDEILQASSLSIEFKEKLRRETQPILLTEILIFKLVSLIGKETQKEDNLTIFDIVNEEKNKKIDEKEQEKEDKEKKEIDETRDREKTDDIIGNWHIVLKKIKEKSRILEAAIREGKPERFEDGILSISFEENFEFHKKRVDENRKTIEKIISKISGKEVKIETFLKKNSKKSILDDEEVKKIITEFNGQVIERED
ncbi:MAG: DNA polymerase III subunit gamma/tau [Elusimicrobia bacterium]|nr:DNA polymerase III subunit gamma/tau [Elusimicrobiota bacterium]